MIYIIVSVIFAALSATFMNLIVYQNEKKYETKQTLVCLLFGGIIGVVFFIINYFGCPVINWNYPTMWIEIFFVIAYSLLIGYVVTDEKLAETKAGKVGLLGIAIFVVLLIILAISTCDIFHFGDRRDLLAPKVIEKVANDKKAATDIAKMCTVSETVARRAILAQMGDLKNTFNIGHLTKQSATCNFVATLADGSKKRIRYTDHIIYVGILEHRSFWTWLSQGFSPAYVIADASDASKVYVVKEVNGTPLEMKYTDEAMLWNDIERYMRNNGYLGTILDDFDVEIDEHGKPFAPVTTVHYRNLWSTAEVTGVAMVDIQTGIIKQFTSDNAPAFVNMIQPSHIVNDRINWWGLLKNWPRFWVRSGRVQACSGMDVVQTPEGSFFYVGVRAESDSVGTLGYMMVNTRTGEATYYKRSGISEEEAARVLAANPDVMLEMNSGVLQLTDLIYYNVEGLGTYFATYVSSSDYTVKYYAFASTTDKSVWGYGKTLDEARTNYLNAYYKNTDRNEIKFANKQILTTVEVQILEKSVVGNVFYFRIKGYDDKVFKTTLSDNMSDILWVPTPKVKISFSKTDSKFVELKSYEIIR